ncbi:hypothetical protein [Lentilactobacillus farraginis]|uniref:O-acetylhomoserine sulfhydrylase n=1 Tax=Lentilactobacillus farraginis DSM 18382 = JCM 14108 TaxID=1423743 RepID=X0PA67_9LACO|nr:hypothetical protein [Lentilactobacillus farraginis]GAF36299.1 O-acetylhomoserine sulfhydrylase [Lentilactobacillus farraginis DSM 18382 = JCM 14108]
MTEEKFDTLRIHGGYDPAQHHDSATVPIYQNVAFSLGSAERGEAVAQGTVPDAYMYSRLVIQLLVYLRSDWLLWTVAQRRWPLAPEWRRLPTLF